MSTHGGKSNARAAKSCRACNGFKAVVETARMTLIHGNDDQSVNPRYVETNALHTHEIRDDSTLPHC